MVWYLLLRSLYIYVCCRRNSDAIFFVKQDSIFVQSYDDEQNINSKNSYYDDKFDDQLFRVLFGDRSNHAKTRTSSQKTARFCVPLATPPLLQLFIVSLFSRKSTGQGVQYIPVAICYTWTEDDSMWVFLCITRIAPTGRGCCNFWTRGDKNWKRLCCWEDHHQTKAKAGRAVAYLARHYCRRSVKGHKSLGVNITSLI